VAGRLFEERPECEEEKKMKRITVEDDLKMDRMRRRIEYWRNGQLERTF
jgi:hypothetical protein